MKEYRADIDGLRALAVVAVMVFHLEKGWLPNGFLGVDVFFVLSGFLITSVLYRSLLRGKFSFKTFYTRRMQRIFPVYFLVLFCGLGLSYYLYLPGNDQATIKSALYGVLFMSNFWFAKDAGYFATAFQSRPFLQTWSLSIEEQFYIFFPILLLGLVCLNAKKGKWGGVIVPLFILTLLFLGSSFLPLDKWGVNWDLYYLSHVRFGEMLLGSCLAIFMIDREALTTANSLSKYQATKYGTLAFLILVLCMSNAFPFEFFDNQSLLILITCVATAILLYYNKTNYWLSRLLSRNSFVWIGKISYSLYLWHWLVLAFVRYFWGDIPLSWGVLLFVLAVTTLLSTLSYYLVEQPIRKMNMTFKKAFFVLYLIPTSFVIFWYKYPKEYYPIADYNQLLNNLVYEDCSDNIEKDCVLGDVSKLPTVLVAGDSHAKQVSAFIDRVGQAEGWSAKLYGATACPFLLDYVFVFRGQTEGLCEKRNKFLAQEYKKYSTIILASYWGGKFYKKDSSFIPHLEQTLEKLLKEGKKVILLNSLYEVQSYRLQEVYAYKKGAMPMWNRDYNELRGDVFQRSQQYGTEIKNLIAEKYPSVEWIDLVRYYTDDLLYNGLPILANNNHLNLYGAKMIAEKFIQNNRLIKSELPK